jgi:hypothetical protein
MGQRRSFGNGRYRPGEDDLTAGPVEAWANPGLLPGLVWSGGLGMTPSNIVQYNSFSGGWEMIPEILGDHYPLCMPGMAVNAPPVPAWGNDLAKAAVGAAVTWLQGSTSPVRAKAGKVFLGAASMGFTNVCAWARTNVASVAGIVAFVPCADLSAIYARNPGGISGGIDFAYGGTYHPATDGPTHNPVQYASTLTCPIHIWAVDSGGGTDGTILLSEIQAFAAAAPNCTVTVLTGTHSAPDWPATFASDLTAFLAANAP